MCIKLFVKLVYHIFAKIDAVARGYFIKNIDCINDTFSHSRWIFSVFSSAI